MRNFFGPLGGFEAGGVGVTPDGKLHGLREDSAGAIEVTLKPG